MRRPFLAVQRPFLVMQRPFLATHCPLFPMFRSFLAMLHVF
jgi:hypothetical protein